MYSWLGGAVANSGTVVTANRRLARALTEAYSSSQLAAGKSAWRSPDIYAWPDWLKMLAETAPAQGELPTRINAQQSQLLWDRCLLQELGESEIRITSLVRLCRDIWQTLSDWQVPIGEVARMAQSDDHRAFASVAGRYLAILEREDWVDDAGLAGVVLRQIEAQSLPVARHYTFAGFERERPMIRAVHEALQACGAEIHTAPLADPAGGSQLHEYASPAEELRSAGAWARQRLEKDPEARIAIIANGLETEADTIARHVREGATPGWQHGHPSLHDAVNVSYGQRLSDYPAIAIGLLLLRWLVDDLSSTDVSVLLRSPLLGSVNTAGRCRLELRLRQLPDRKWSPSMLTAEFRSNEEGSVVDEFLALLAAFSKRRRDTPKSASPSDWAQFADDTLRSFAWPGAGPLSSSEFQLINRWRELLNEFARLGLVSATMSPRTAISRIELMAGETVFQAESVSGAIQLMGPLEASGAEFDGIWISAASTANWPPAGSPSALVSRRLQEKFGMPDSTPGDTIDYANRVLRSLLSSSDVSVCSLALVVDDSEQTASDLLMPYVTAPQEGLGDPGLYAASLTSLCNVGPADDEVPAVAAGERISGGAGTIQLQIMNPVAAFVQGRLGARPIYPQAVGIPPAMRGNLIHDALYKLYIDLPSRTEISAWDGDQLNTRIGAAVDFAFSRHEKNLDAVLLQLLLHERRRIADLLQQFVVVDSSRDEFRVAGVEGTFEFVAGHIRLPLRFDRIDQFDDGAIEIIDYKTGTRKQLLNRDNEPQEIQLFVYAMATDAEVSALALVNLDSREIDFSGAGRGFTDVDEWPALLARVKDEVAAACVDMSAGDVRLNIEQGITAARPLNLLTRYTELRHDGE